MPGVGGERREQAVGCVQRGGVGGGVDHGDDGVETGAGDVVGVPRAGAVGGVVVRGEDEARAYRVSGVVHGEHGRAGGGRVPHLGVEALLQRGGEAQRRVHQLLAAEDQYAAGAWRQRLGDAVRHAGQRGLQCVPVRGREAVAPSVGDPRRPAQLDADGPGHGAGGRLAGRRRPRGLRGRAPLLPARGRVVAVHQGLALRQDVLGQADGARGHGDQVDPGADLAGELLQPPPVPRRAHVDQGHDHVPLARVARVQVADGVEHRVAGGELVVDQDQRPLAGQQRGVLGQQQVGGGVRVGLLEAAGRLDAVDRAARRVQVRCHADAVGHRVAEAGRRLGVPEDDRACGGLVAQQLAHALAECEARPVHPRRQLRHMLAQHVRHQQMGPLGVAAQGQSQQIPQPARPLVPAVTDEFDAEPLRDPRSRPHHVLGPHLSPVSPLSAAPRSRRPHAPRRTPRRAAWCAPPRHGAASLRSSCSYTRNASLRHRRAPVAGCPARR